ncbi:helix-turn-helix transcriptional regulator [Tropicibacter sp. S64]|uniref:helix-turn-helix transcriptional regulator n=1 Tax=Tropicibacter sp. S64 TaxID=3415122 RepID=UPI003C7BE169
MVDRIHDVVLRVYDAAADDALWPDVLQQIADECGAVGCIVFEWDGMPHNRVLRPTVASSYYDLAAIGTYIEKCYPDECRDQDIFEAHSLRLDRVDLIEDDVLAPSMEALKALPNVQTLQKLGILHRAAGLLNKDNTAISRFSVQFGADRGRFSTVERVFMTTVLPHVAKAFDLGRPAMQLARDNLGLIAAIEQLSIGICILDRGGRRIVSNGEFQRQHETYRVFRIAPDGSIRFTKPEDERRFATLKRHAFEHGQYGARPRKEAISAGEDSYLCIEIAPLHKLGEIGTERLDGFILYSADTSLPLHCNTSPIKQAFGLTDTEQDLIAGIADGLTNAQIAEMRGRSVATVNSQVKSILSKTHCATRTQLVRLMMSFGVDYIVRKE